MEFKAFTFVIALAAVVNGLGLVRILSGLEEYIRHQEKVEVLHYWVYALWIAFQFLLHLLLWWTMWGLHEAGKFTFLHLIFVLMAPILLYLGSSLLIPDAGESPLNLRSHFYGIRKSYFTIASLLWLWATLQVPVFSGSSTASAPIWVALLAIAIVLRTTASPKVHAALVIASWVLISLFTAVFALNLGQVPAG